jgi:hypothetical protein
VRKIDAEGIRKRLDDHEVVLISPIGFSPTGDVFNCTLEDVATAAAIALGADKLIFLIEKAGALDARGRLISELTVKQARSCSRPSHARRRRADLHAARDQGVRERREARAPHQPPRRRGAADRALHPPRHRHDGGARVARAIRPRSRATSPASCRSSSRSSSRASSCAPSEELERDLGHASS